MVSRESFSLRKITPAITDTTVVILEKTVVLAKRKISEQLKNGKKPPEIAQMYNLSVRRIYDLIKKYKLLPPQKAFHKSVEDSVIPLAKEGHSQKFISEKTGVKGVDIRKALQKWKCLGAGPEESAESYEPWL